MLLAVYVSILLMLVKAENSFGLASVGYGLKIYWPVFASVFGFSK